MNERIHPIHWVYAIILILTVWVASVGLYSADGGTPYVYTNQYGTAITLYGDGLYANDSFFKAPIFRASDATILFVVVPIFLFFLIRNIAKQDKLSRSLLTSSIAMLLYYSASLSFGVVFNELHLPYIALFAGTLFSLIWLLSQEKTDYSSIRLPYKSIHAFLIVSGVALIVAWLPDIITAMLKGTSLALIENYTTEITYVLDMGIIAPACFATVKLLRNRKPLGYEVLVILLFVCSMVGIMVCVQTAFQSAAGIVLPIGALITKMAIFVALAAFSISLLYRVLRRTTNSANSR
jgi:hypothetical protein